MLLVSFAVGLLMPYWRDSFYNMGIVEIDRWGWWWAGLGWVSFCPFAFNHDTALGAAWFAVPVFLIGAFVLHRRKYAASAAIFLLALFLQSIFWHDGGLRGHQKYVGAYWHFATMFVAYSWALILWVESVVQSRNLDIPAAPALPSRQG